MTSAMIKHDQTKDGNGMTREQFCDWCHKMCAHVFNEPYTHPNRVWQGIYDVAFKDGFIAGICETIGLEYEVDKGKKLK